MASDFSALMENVITCPVCLRHFDDPRMLSCKHTFCLQCIQQMVSHDNGMLECPKRDGPPVAVDDINTLTKNEAVSKLLQLFSKWDTCYCYQGSPNFSIYSFACPSLDHPNINTPLCYRCENIVAEHWCDGECKHCFCSQCWEHIHGLGHYRNHPKVPISDRPAEVVKCQDHDIDDKAKHWCEICSKEICNNCQQMKHKDHRVTLLTGDVKPLEEEVSIHLKLRK